MFARLLLALFLLWVNAVSAQYGPSGGSYGPRSGGGSSGPTCPGIMLSPIASVVAGAPGSLSGVYCGTAPTGIDYSLDGGSTYTASSTPTISGNLFSFSLTAPGGGTYTVYTREEPGTTMVSNPQTWVVTSGSTSVLLANTGVGILVNTGVKMLVQ